MLKPDVVLLSANWSWYAGDKVIRRDNLAAEFSRTIRALKAAGVLKVVLVGPVPQWGEGGLPSARPRPATRQARSDPVSADMVAYLRGIAN